MLLGAAAVPLTKIDSDRLVERYQRTGDDFLSAGGRGQVWQDTTTIAAAFPWTGSGFGTFGAVYPIFRSPRVRLFYAHAHNDWLQALAEGGLLGAVLIAMLALPLLGTLRRSLFGAKGVLATGIAAGVTAILLHGIVDFNFHIPANLATAAVLAGLLQGLPWKRRG